MAANAAKAASRSFVRLTPALVKPAADCVAETFATQADPFTWLFNLRRHHWWQMSASFIDRAAHASQPMSVVAVNSATNEVDGVMINEDFKLQPPAAYRTSLGSDWRPVRAIFAELHTRFKASNHGAIVPGEMLHCLYFTCVRPSARGQGVMKGLWDHTLQIASDHNFKSVVAEAGSEHVRQVLEDHLGFKESTSVKYSEFMFEGQPMFAELTKHDPAQYSRLSMHRRGISSGLYV